MNFKEEVANNVNHQIAYEKERLIANAVMDEKAEIIIASKVELDISNNLIKIVVKEIHHRDELKGWDGEIEMYRLID